MQSALVLLRDCNVVEETLSAIPFRMFDVKAGTTYENNGVFDTTDYMSKPHVPAKPYKE